MDTTFLFPTRFFFFLCEHTIEPVLLALKTVTIGGLHTTLVPCVVLDELERARGLGAEQIGQAMKAHTAVFRGAQAFFEDYDLLITPAASVAPFPHGDIYPAQIDGTALNGYLIWEAIAWGITLTQCPAVVIPCGRDASGLPFGIQIVGPHLRDGWLLDVAHTLETVFAGDADLGRPIPDLTQIPKTT